MPTANNKFNPDLHGFNSEEEFLNSEVNFEDTPYLGECPAVEEVEEVDDSGPAIRIEWPVDEELDNRPPGNPQEPENRITALTSVSLQLTQRQHDVALALVMGEKPANIAKRMGIGIQTVYQISCNPLVKQYRGELRLQAEKAVMDAKVSMCLAAPEAAYFKLQVLRGEGVGQSAPFDARIATANDILDRVGVRAATKTQTQASIAIGVVGSSMLDRVRACVNPTHFDTSSIVVEAEQTSPPE